MYAQEMIDNTVGAAKGTGASLSYGTPQDDPADPLLVFIVRGEKAKRAYNAVSGLYDQDTYDGIVSIEAEERDSL